MIRPPSTPLSGSTAPRRAPAAARMRAIVLRTNQLESMVRDDRRMTNDASVRLVIDILRQDLNLEPVVKEEMERQDRLLLRKSGGPRI